MTQMGHEEQFSPPTLSARYGIRQETFAGTHGNARDAPIPDLPVLAPERGGSTQSGRSCRGLIGLFLMRDEVRTTQQMPIGPCAVRPNQWARRATKRGDVMSFTAMLLRGEISLDSKPPEMCAR